MEERKILIDVELLIRNVQGFINGFKNVRQSIISNSQQLQNFNAGVFRYGAQTALFVQQAGKNFLSLGNMIGGIGSMFAKTAQSGVRFYQGMNKILYSLFGFKMQFLGIMFAGLGLQKLFMGLLSPALELSGIFDIITTILQLFFLPIALALIDPLLALMDLFLNMSDETKLWIGKLVLMGVALGTALFFIGSFVLAITSILGVLASLALKAAIFWIILQILDLFFPATERLKAAFEKISESLGALWSRFLDTAPVQKFLKAIGLTDEDIEKLRHPWEFLKEKISGIWEDLKIGIQAKIVWLQTWLVITFKQMILALTGLETWKEFLKVWDDFKDKALEVIDLIEGAWKGIEGLKLPDWLAKLWNRKIEVGAAALVGTAVAGPVGGAVGGGLMFTAEELAQRIAEALKSINWRTGEITNPVFNISINGVPTTDVTVQVDRMSGGRG